MTDRPILFSADMVNAILAGKKTQARRVARLTDAGHLKEPRGHRRWHPGDANAVTACPYGQPGDRLWVRETWAAHPLDNQDPPCRVLYRADGANWWRWPDGPERGRRSDDFPHWVPDRWRPSIFMPRWASRITLKVTGVRVERLRDISKEDARAEGTPVGQEVPATINGEPGTMVCFEPILSFSLLWDSINGKRHGCDWASNPWAWVVEFEREQADD